MERTAERPVSRIEVRWLLVAVVLLGAVAGLAAFVSDRLPPFDSSVLAEFRRLQETPLWPLLQGVNLAGYPIVWDTLVFAGTAYLAFRWRQPWPLLLPAWLLIGESAAVLVKLGVDRLRPPGVVIQDLVTAASFPSGHVTRIAVTVGVAVVIAWPALRRRMAAVIAAAASAVVMGIARMAAGEHWPTDVLGALLLSGAIVSVAAATAGVATSAVRTRRPSPRSRP
jgi:undecaprenyl-diphosphatase